MTDESKPDTALRACAEDKANEGELDLAPIKARAAAATEGPWTNGIRGSGSSGDAHMCRIIARGHETAKNPTIVGAQIGETWDAHHAVSYVGLSRQECIDNAEFMAHAREDIPALIAEVERLRACAEAPATDVDAILKTLGPWLKHNSQGALCCADACFCGMVKAIYDLRAEALAPSPDAGLPVQTFTDTEIAAVDRALQIEIAEGDGISLELRGKVIQTIALSGRR